MGRETTAKVSWKGQSGEAKILLESTDLILRGEVKAKFARSSITNARADPAGLNLTIYGSDLRVSMSEAEATRWVLAIEKPPPSLAAKLGIGPERPAYVLGKVDDQSLAEALNEATVAAAEHASKLLAIIEDETGLDLALSCARKHPGLAVWCVYPKGKAADPGDAAIRDAFRAAGWMDNKTSAVSGRLTATRFARKA
jgi:hypothetical protein